MTVFNSKINTSSDSFLKNREDMLTLVNRLQELNARAPAISARRKSRFDSRGQLLPRERLARLLDPGMPFLEIGNLAGYLVDTKEEEKSIPGSTVIAGIGFVKGCAQRHRRRRQRHNGGRNDNRWCRSHLAGGACRPQAETAVYSPC